MQMKAAVVSPSFSFGLLQYPYNPKSTRVVRVQEYWVVNRSPAGMGTNLFSQGVGRPGPAPPALIGPLPDVATGQSERLGDR